MPESWVWVRLGDVLTVSSGKNLNQKQMTDNGKYPVYGGNGITGFYDDFLVKKGTLVIGRVGFYCGSAHKVIFDSWVTDNALIVYPMGNIFNSDYLCYLLNFLDLKKSSVATAQPVISGQRIYKEEIPLPPLNEQHRIVAKIEELLPFIEQYDQKEQQLTALNKNFPEQLKKSILQAAIQGKLTEQLPTDEPASELLKRIQVEKARLISEKKLKKPKHTSEIIIRDNLAYEIKDGVERCIADEIPFEIPESWCWVRLGDIFEIISGVTYSKQDQINTTDGIRIIRGGNIFGNKLELYDNDVWIKNGKVKETQFLQIRDIITPSVTSLENVGKFALVKAKVENTAIGGFVFCLRYHYQNIVSLATNYLFLLLCSDFVKKQMQERTNKSGQAFYNLGKSKFEEILLPIPALEEQKRIVKKVELLLSSINHL
nr:restriction endonuclease subunit S [Actinobacillus porcinus]